jgi:hypothetical protein
MVSDQDICQASFESRANGGDISGTASCDKDHAGVLFPDLFLETRNRETGQVVGRRLHQLINTVSLSIEYSVVDIHDRMVRLHRIDLLPGEDASHDDFII